MCANRSACLLALVMIPSPRFYPTLSLSSLLVVERELHVVETRVCRHAPRQRDYSIPHSVMSRAQVFCDANRNPNETAPKTVMQLAPLLARPPNPPLRGRFRSVVHHTPRIRRHRAAKSGRLLSSPTPSTAHAISQEGDNGQEDAIRQQRPDGRRAHGLRHLWRPCEPPPRRDVLGESGGRRVAFSLQ